MELSNTIKDQFNRVTTNTSELNNRNLSAANIPYFARPSNLTESSFDSYFKTNKTTGHTSNYDRDYRYGPNRSFNNTHERFDTLNDSNNSSFNRNNRFDNNRSHNRSISYDSFNRYHHDNHDHDNRNKNYINSNYNNSNYNNRLYSRPPYGANEHYNNKIQINANSDNNNNNNSTNRYRSSNNDDNNRSFTRPPDYEPINPSTIQSDPISHNSSIIVSTTNKNNHDIHPLSTVSKPNKPPSNENNLKREPNDIVVQNLLPRYQNDYDSDEEKKQLKIITVKNL